jgi:hypothetical protein
MIKFLKFNKKFSKTLVVDIFLVFILVCIGLMLPFGVRAENTAPEPDPDATDVCSEVQTGGRGQPSDIPAYCKERDQRFTSNPADPFSDSQSPLIGPNSILYKIIQLVTLLTGAISIIMIMVGGFRYIVSGGDSNATKAAKDTILYAVIGLAIAIFAQTIITFVLSNL